MIIDFFFNLNNFFLREKKLIEKDESFRLHFTSFYWLNYKNVFKREIFYEIYSMDLSTNIKNLYVFPICRCHSKNSLYMLLPFFIFFN